MTQHFGDRVASRVAQRCSQLVLGLDPDPLRLWPDAAAVLAGTVGEPGERAAAGVVAHCRALIDAAGPACVGVKPQVACFERLGAPGWAALAAVSEHARGAGLLVIADAKRGDIDVSAVAYGQAFFGGLDTPFGRVPGLGADALTVNPLLGADGLRPLLDAARAAGGGGIFALVRTSNPGAADVQGLELRDGGDVSERLAALVTRLGDEATAGAPAGLSDVGAVVGATASERLSRLRELMPRSIFLLPGVGAQGGRVEDLAPAFAPGVAGGLVAVSRAIARAHEHSGGTPADAARGQAERLRAETWALS